MPLSSAIDDNEFNTGGGGGGDGGGEGRGRESDGGVGGSRGDDSDER